MINRLFVYGSLQPGGPNSHVLEPLGGSWQPATVRGRLISKGWGAELGFPGLVLDDEAQAVSGQLLSCPGLAEFWEELDRFEGDGYQRIKATARLANGESVTAYVYSLKQQ